MANGNPFYLIASPFCSILLVAYFSCEVLQMLSNIFQTNSKLLEKAEKCVWGRDLVPKFFFRNRIQFNSPICFMVSRNLNPLMSRSLTFSTPKDHEKTGPYTMEVKQNSGDVQTQLMAPSTLNGLQSSFSNRCQTAILHVDAYFLVIDPLHRSRQCLLNLCLNVITDSLLFKWLSDCLRLVAK